MAELVLQGALAPLGPLPMLLARREQVLPVWPVLQALPALPVLPVLPVLQRWKLVLAQRELVLALEVFARATSKPSLRKRSSQKKPFPD